MCTVTFLPHRHGYSLGMNRDEQLTRARGLAPIIREVSAPNAPLGRRWVTGPSEPGGGSWISLNDAGVTIALINWYSVSVGGNQPFVSRGLVVNAAAGAESPEEVKTALESLPWDRLKPFRLIGVFPVTTRVVEWRWNRQVLEECSGPWRAEQWASSGFDEPRAQVNRRQVFAAAGLPLTRQLEWLRRLHRCHEKGPGPFSICMHRADAATVSYTEIQVSRVRRTLSYLPGPPCEWDELPRSVQRLPAPETPPVQGNPGAAVNRITTSKRAGKTP